MSLTRTLERLERFGDSDADRAIRPPVLDPEPEPSRPRRSWRVRALVAVAVLAVLGVVVGYVVAFSPVLGVRQIQVTGARTLSTAQVQQAAGISAGTPLVRLDTAAVAARIEAVPVIATATVTVSYPSTVSIAVTERTAVLRLAGPDRLVDVTGRAYATVPAGEPTPALPLTSVPTAELPVAAVAAAALPAASRDLVGRIDVDQGPSGAPPTLTLTLTDGRTVEWGTTERSAEKGQLLAAVLGPGGTAVTGNTIDLSDPDTVLTTP